MYFCPIRNHVDSCPPIRSSDKILSTNKNACLQSKCFMVLSSLSVPKFLFFDSKGVHQPRSSRKNLQPLHFFKSVKSKLFFEKSSLKHSLNQANVNYKCCYRFFPPLPHLPWVQRSYELLVEDRNNVDADMVTMETEESD